MYSHFYPLLWLGRRNKDLLPCRQTPTPHGPSQAIDLNADHLVLGTVFFGIGTICIFNSTQNFFIYTFTRYPASAFGAAALFNVPSFRNVEVCRTRAWMGTCCCCWGGDIVDAYADAHYETRTEDARLVSS